ncbi:hypothetical protein HYPSUDRAFT_816348 [Hypholoma sublateritium FD-334 SS-4]|uniref:Uncharacterized protein n=1 Tax=Hypholoma sublateritium (strain FD-334 SS-4) TaxID=945553 RepID=A0A0D2MAC9_HYPSF|nr:hypothetical protein HYPSUDRAFT_816348 [Hypholoma sublateritium FD-334 SS-4]
MMPTGVTLAARMHGTVQQRGRGALLFLVGRAPIILVMYHASLIAGPISHARQRGRTPAARSANDSSPRLRTLAVKFVLVFTVAHTAEVCSLFQKPGKDIHFGTHAMSSAAHIRPNRPASEATRGPLNATPKLINGCILRKYTRTAVNYTQHIPRGPRALNARGARRATANYRIVRHQART